MQTGRPVIFIIEQKQLEVGPWHAPPVDNNLQRILSGGHAKLLHHCRNTTFVQFIVFFDHNKQTH